jgi:5'-deoxynucleotidase YfbR-like HD superfamily hydrolase
VKLTDLLALSHVPRWSIVPTVRSQTVGDHSFRVGVLYLELASRLKLQPTLEALSAALWHDGAEARTGDISSEFKKGQLPDLPAAEKKVCPWLPDTSKLSPDDRKLLKVADLLDAATFIWMYGVGDHAERVKKRLLDRMTEVSGTWYPEVRLMFNDIVEERER